MTRNEIAKTATGSVISFEETPEERARRIERTGREAEGRIRLTPGQRQTLRRVQGRLRQRAQTA
jgi:hypothetical protein